MSDVFDTVVAYFNITEHLFFGLALAQSSEYFFLDNDHRLEKSAPVGWKSSGGAGIGGGGSSPLRGHGNEYILHLRFRYYPKRMEFVRNENVAHYLYLQLRQDMLSGTLRFDAEKAFELAALALQAESHQNYRPTDDADYFKLENYLPSV